MPNLLLYKIANNLVISELSSKFALRFWILEGKMKFTIENIEEFSGGMAQIYSVMFEGDDMTLIDLNI